MSSASPKAARRHDEFTGAESLRLSAPALSEGGGLSIAYISIEASKWVWNHSRSTSHARLVLLAIAAHCNDDGWAWPKLDILEEAANASRPTVLQALEKLEKELKEIL